MANAVDAALLKRGLQDYQVTLDMHLRRLQEEFEVLSRGYAAFQSVYEGDAAREFHSHWLRTQAGFKQYIEGTSRVNKLLEERITALVAAERTGLLGM